MEPSAQVFNIECANLVHAACGCLKQKMYKKNIIAAKQRILSNLTEHVDVYAIRWAFVCGPVGIVWKCTLASLFALLVSGNRTANMM